MTKFFTIEQVIEIHNAFLECHRVRALFNANMHSAIILSFSR